ncbi:MAG: hypothetical protein IKD59_05535 [Lachnospiraceae bacterium]|nr:hypothetical protein [Lachnospiraceae bacterium]
MIFRSKRDEIIEVAAEEHDDREMDQRIINDLKTMQMQIESDIRLLKNTLAQLEEKYGIAYEGDDYVIPVDHD